MGLSGLRMRAAAVVGLGLAVATAGMAPVASAGGAAAGRISAFGVSRPGVPQELNTTDLKRIKSVNVNHVAVDVWQDVDSVDPTLVHPGAITATDLELGLTI